MANALGAASSSPRRSRASCRPSRSACWGRSCCCRRCPPGGAARRRPGNDVRRRCPGEDRAQHLPGGKGVDGGAPRGVRIDEDPDADRPGPGDARAPLPGLGRPLLVAPPGWCASTPSPTAAALARAARRHDARGPPGPKTQRVDAARRHQPGHLGADRRPGGHLLDAAFAAVGGRHRRPPPPVSSSRTAANLFWLGRYTERTEAAGAAGAPLMLDNDQRRRRISCTGAVGDAVRCSTAWRPVGVPTLVQSAHGVRARRCSATTTPQPPPASPSTWRAGTRAALRETPVVPSNGA